MRHYVKVYSTLIEAASYNVARKNKDVKLFEIGNVFFANGEGELQIKLNI